MKLHVPPHVLGFDQRETRPALMSFALPEG